MFPNEMTFLNAVSQYGSVIPYIEPRRTFRFTIGRTF